MFQLRPEESFAIPIGMDVALCSLMSFAITYRDLDTWQQAMELVERCYRVTASFPKSELYGITSQIRRAAVSIPSNVAEGERRGSTRAYVNHVNIALGSHGELETCIELSSRLGFMLRTERPDLVSACESVGRLLNGLLRSLERKLEESTEAQAPSP
jgi:four helix bundle protein